MKLFFTTLAINMASILCVVGAFLLAFNRVQGWGWFLSISLCLSGSVTLGKNGKDKVE